MARNIIPYKSNLKALARTHRNNSTPAEIRLWQELKNKQFYSYDFHRQKPLLNYIVDFYCAELFLVIELDGRYHEEIVDQDLVRTQNLETYNLTVLRFSEHEVLSDMINVLRTIEAYISNSSFDKFKIRTHP